MKKWIWAVLAIFIMTVPLGVSANPRDSDRPQQGPREDSRQPGDQQQEMGKKDSMPFKWHERRGSFSPDCHRMERIDDHRWKNKVPGAHPYRWHDRRGEGFMYQGNRITEAIFFYDGSDELVSIGFMKNGIFIIIHADRGEERGHDSFFGEWMRQH